MAGTRLCRRQLARRKPDVPMGMITSVLFELDGKRDRPLMAELRQCRRQFELLIPVTHLYHRTSYLQKLKRNLDRRLLAGSTRWSFRRIAAIENFRCRRTSAFWLTCLLTHSAISCRSGLHLNTCPMGYACNSADGVLAMIVWLPPAGGPKAAIALNNGRGCPRQRPR